MQGAAALENSSGVGTEPSYQIASIYAPAPEHAFRASYSLAYTHRDLLPAFGDMTLAGGIHLIGDPALNSTPYSSSRIKRATTGLILTSVFKLTSACITRRLTISTISPRCAYLHDDTIVNYDDSITRGAELSLKYHFSRSNGCMPITPMSILQTSRVIGAWRRTILRRTSSILAERQALGTGSPPASTSL